MNFKATKTPLLIAAMAAAVTLTSLAPTNAATLSTATSVQNLQVVNGDFQVLDTNTKFNQFSTARNFDENSGLENKESASKYSFAKKKTFEPKYSFARKKGLKKLF